MSERLSGLAAAASEVGASVCGGLARVVCGRLPDVSCRGAGVRRVANAVVSRWRHGRYRLAGRALLALALFWSAPVIAAGLPPFEGVPIPNGASPWIAYRDWYAQNPGKPYSALRSETVNQQRFEVREGELFDGASRSELGGTTFNIPVAGNTIMWAASVLFEDTGAITSEWQIFSQLHSDDTSAISYPPFWIEFIGDDTVTVNTRTSNGTLVTHWTSPRITRNTWHDFVVRIALDHAGSGTLEFWWEGRKVVDYTGEIGYADSAFVYLKYGVYRGVSAGTTAIRFANVEIGTADLTSRIDAPLDVDTPLPTPPLDGTSPSVALAPGVLLLSSFQGNQLQRQADAIGAYTAWIDQSGNGFNWTQPSSWFQPAFMFTEGGLIAGHFAGGGQRLEYLDGPTGTMADFLSVDHGYMIVRFAITAPPGNDSATAVANPALVAPSVEAPTMGIYIKDSGAGPPYVAQIVNVDGDGEDVVDLPGVGLGTYHTAEWRHEGGQLYGRIDGGAWTQVASGDTTALSASGRLGHSWASFVGTIVAVAIYDAVPPPSTMDAIQAATAAIPAR